MFNFLWECYTCFQSLSWPEHFKLTVLNGKMVLDKKKASFANTSLLFASFSSFNHFLSLMSLIKPTSAHLGLYASLRQDKKTAETGYWFIHSWLLWTGSHFKLFVWRIRQRQSVHGLCMLLVNISATSWGQLGAIFWESFLNRKQTIRS